MEQNYCCRVNIGLIYLIKIYKYKDKVCYSLYYSIGKKIDQ